MDGREKYNLSGPLGSIIALLFPLQRFFLSSLFSSIKTSDLSWHERVPYCSQSNEPYCDIEKELANCERHFFEGDLVNRWKAIDPGHSASFTIAEIKFGTGLNFLLAWYYWLQHAPATARLHFICCETNPLNRHDLSLILALWPKVAREAGIFLLDYPVLTPGFHHLVFEEGRINLTFMLGDSSLCFRQLLHCGDVSLEKSLRYNHVDAWLVKAEIPDDELFKSVAMLSKVGTTLTGYTDSASLRTKLAEAGFETDNGHARFIKAVKNTKIRNTPWHCHVANGVTSKHAIVIGAGLAGCLTAHSLARRGWEILLVDSAADVAKGASGNNQAVLYPKLSAFDSPLTAYMLSAYLYASRFYSKIDALHPIGELSGVLELACNPRQTDIHLRMLEWLAIYPELGKRVSASEASGISGITQQHGGLYLPLSGWLDSSAICQFLIQTPGIHLITNHHVDKLDYEQGSWSIGGGYRSKTIVIASGFQANQFQQTAHLPIQAVAGLLTRIRSNEKTEQLKIPLCGDGHILPAREGAHILGATYHQDTEYIKNRQKDDEENLAKLESINNKQLFSHDVIGNWSGTRGAVSDYLPLVGPVPNREAFEQTFKMLATDSRRWLPHAGDYYPGMYVCAGFGSRGLTSAPLSAEWLATIINKDPSILPHRLVQAVSPSRFLIKKIIKNRKICDFD